MRIGAGRALGVTVWAAMLAPAAAIGQTAAPAGGTGAGSVVLPAVTVTGAGETATSPVQGYVPTRQASGTKTDTSILETPQSISVVPRDQIREQKAQSLNEVLRYTSGVTPETRGAVATRYDMLKIRGFDASMYWNGMKLQSLYYIQPQIDPYMLERAEVLKGPSSVLYGQAAAGGMINQVSKRPQATAEHEVAIEYGTNAHRRAMADSTGPIDAEGKFLYRFTATGLDENGQIRMTENQRVAVAPSFEWRPDADTRLTLTALYQRDPKANSYGGVPPQGTVLANPYGKIPSNFYDGDPNYEKFDREQASIGYEFERRLTNDWTVRLNGRWLRTELAYDSVYANGMQADNRTLSRGLSTSREALRSYTFDNQVEGKITTGALRHTLLFGLDYQRATGFYDVGWSPFGPDLDVFAPVYGLPIAALPRSRTDVDSSQWGVYAQDQIHLGGFILTLAGRQDWARTDSRSAYGASHQFDSAFTGRAGLTYVFENGIAPYIAYAESFVPQSGTDFNGQGFDPEEGKLYEIGVKYQPTGLNGLFTAALFDLTRSNLLTGDPAHAGFSVQTGEVRSRGLELEARAAITPQLDLIAAYTYLDTEYTKDNSGFEGKELAAVPHHAASGWAVYRMEKGTTLDGLSLGGGVRWQSSTANQANTYRVPSFTLVDAMASFDLGKLSSKLEGAEVSVNAKNLFDKEYVASCYYGDWCAYGYGRTVIAGLRYRW